MIQSLRAFHGRWESQGVYCLTKNMVEGVLHLAHLLLLPDPSFLEVVNVEVNDQLKLITVTATTTATEAACPLCQHTSLRVPSHYHRTLADLPCCRQRVQWIV